MLHFLLRRSKADGQEHSLEVQRAGCAAFAAARGIKSKALEHVSDGVAGDDVEGLTALRRLLEQVKPGDVVVCRDHSRLGRDMLESTLHIRQLVADSGAQLFYYSTGEQVHSRNAMDEVMSVLRGFGAQSELENIRARTREALRARVKQARIAGGAVYGYDRKRVVDASGGSHTVAVINEKQAEIIRRIFAEFIAGAGLKRIAIGLNDELVPFPKVGRRGSGSWSPGQVRDILRRERYIGLYVHGRINRVKKGGKRLCSKAPESQIMRVEIPEWRIVDDLTWRRAQAIIAERAPMSPFGKITPEALARRNSENRASSLLGGLGVCGVCGGAVGVVGTRSVGRMTVKAYGCLTHKSRGAQICSVKTRRPVTVVENALADALRIVVEHPEVVDVLMTALRAEVEAQALGAATIDLGNLEAERMELRRKARNLSNAIAGFAGDENGIPPALLEQLAAANARTVQVEKAFATATRAPVEAAAFIAQAEATVRAELQDLRGVLASEAQLSREFLQRHLKGLTFTPDENHRYVIEAGVDLIGNTTGDPSGIRTRVTSVKV